MFPGESVQDTALWVREAGGTVVTTQPQSLVASVSAGDVAQLAVAGQFAGEIPADPNPVSGFGRVDVAAAISPASGGRPLFVDDADDAVVTGEMKTYDVQDVDPDHPLNVTLVWTDAPAPAGVGGVGGLENQLYLQVVGARRYRAGWRRDLVPIATNNVQQIAVDHPLGGVYRIRVRGVTVVHQAPASVRTRAKTSQSWSPTAVT